MLRRQATRGNVIGTVDPKGNTVQMAYDGAGRMIESVQHMRASGGGDQAPQPANMVTGGETPSLTGASSPASSAQQGTFMPASGSVIRTQTIYDGNSRVVALIDSNGGTTNYTYDALNRQVTMEFADGTKRTNTYNACSSVVMYKDEAGNQFTNTYDSLSRRVAVSIAAETGFEGTAAQTFQYDGAGRQTQTTDTRASGTQTTNTQYDSLGRVLEFAQTTGSDTQYMTSTGFTSMVNTQQQYPNANKVDWAYDILYRKASVKDNGAGSNTAAWTYAGPGRVVEVVLKNGIACTMLNNTRTASVVQTMIPGSDNASNSLPMFGTAASDRLGYDGSGRMVAKRFIPAGLNGEGGYTSTTPVVGFTTSFDKAGNKYYERMLHAENRSHLYQPYPWNYNTSQTASGNMTGDVGLFPPPYDPNASGIDSANRLRQYERGTLAGPVYGYLPTGALPGTPGSGGHAITTPINLPGTDSFKNYTLDALGNWESSASTDSVTPPTAVSNPVLEQRNHNLLNQITRRKVGSGEWVDFVYDKNGNLRDDGERLMTYDALNRLIKVEKKMTSPTPPVLIAEYTYNAMMFRTLKTVSSSIEPGVPTGTTRYLYNASWQVMEERSRSGSDPSYTWTPVKQNVWGQYIDELIQLKLLVASGPQSPQLPIGDYYPLQDLLYRTQALTNSSGNIVEAYDYDAYGNTIIFKAPETGGNWFASDALQASWGANDALYCGYINNHETRIYLSRFRFYIPSFAIWAHRDFIADNNLYVYANCQPSKYSDPFGLWVSTNEISFPDSVIDAIQNVSNNSWSKESSSSVYQKMGINKHSLIGARRRIFAALADHFSPIGDIHNRFIFTCGAGWVDVGHFFAALQLAYATSPDMSFHQMYEIEQMQQIAKSMPYGLGGGFGSSAYTPEDLPSNAFGAVLGGVIRAADESLFSQRRLVPVKDVLNIGNLFSRFLREMGAVKEGNLSPQCSAGAMTTVRGLLVADASQTKTVGLTARTAREAIDKQTDPTRLVMCCLCDGPKPKAGYAW